MNDDAIPEKPPWLSAINEALRNIVQDVLAGKINDATARCNLRQAIIAAGYHPGTAHIEPDSPEDLLFDARMNLAIKTNVEMAQGAGRFFQANDPAVIDGFPAMELVRYEDRKSPRDWEQRWKIAAQVANDQRAAAVLELHGRMVALKSSGIWQALGDGAGGFDDHLGNPYPPFALNSGMWTESVSHEEAEAFGLASLTDVINAHKTVSVTPQLPIESELFTAFLWNEPRPCDHCDEEKPFILLTTCDSCGELVCPDCTAKECTGSEAPPLPSSAMQCFSTAVGKMRGEKLPLRKDVAEEVLQWCDRAFEFGFAAHFHDFEARANRMRGEAFESLGQKERALREYELALEKDAEVGLKKRIISLRKELTKT